MSGSQVAPAIEDHVPGSRTSPLVAAARGCAPAAALLDERLVAVGILAAGLAHEIATPLQYARDSLHLARDLLIGLDRSDGSVAVDEQSARGTAQEVEAAVGRALDGVERVAALAGRLSRFVRADGFDGVPTDVEATILDALAIARNEYRYVARLAG